MARIGIACLLALTACIVSPSAPDDAIILCAADGRCPSGWTCNDELNRCIRDGTSVVVPADPGIQVSPTELTTDEGGTLTPSFAVSLASEPIAAVTIEVRSSDTTESTTDVASLVFAVGTWNQPQTVSVNGVDDDVDDGDVTFDILVLPAESEDPGYAGLDPADVTVTNQDNDTAGVDVALTGGDQTTEAGGTTTFTIVLAAEPLGTVTVSFSSSDESEGTVSSDAVVFDDTDWYQPETVTVMGEDDDADDGDTQYQIDFVVTQTDSPAFASLSLDPLVLTNTDDDGAGITLSENQLFVREDGGAAASAAFDVVLTADPVVEITLEVTSADTGEITVAPATLDFGSGDWTVPQTVMVTSVDDLISDGAQAVTVTVEVTPADLSVYGATSRTVQVLNVDADGKRMFVTDATHNGVFTDVDVADAMCSADKNYPGAGTYKALFAKPGDREACTSEYCDNGGVSEHEDWVLAPDTAYTRLDDVTLIGTTTSVGLLSGSFNGIDDNYNNYWTGLEPDWQHDGWNCLNWSSNSSGEQGRRGGSTGSGVSLWSASSRSNCNEPLHILCVEQ